MQDELELLQRFLDIEQARFGARLVVDVELDEEAKDALVPALVCQPLVENAIRHGVARRSGPVAVRVRVTREGDALLLEITDTGRGLGAKPVREGIGLSNTRARLRELYGDAASLRLDDATADGAVATIRLPFHLAANQDYVSASA